MPRAGGQQDDRRTERQDCPLGGATCDGVDGHRACTGAGPHRGHDHERQSGDRGQNREPDGRMHLAVFTPKAVASWAVRLCLHHEPLSCVQLLVNHRPMEMLLARAVTRATPVYPMIRQL